MHHRSFAGAAMATAALIALSGCAAQVSDRDRRALDDLARVAPATSTIDPALADWTECWLPSEHPITDGSAPDDTSWRVLCRIHWHEEDGKQRLQDTTCIGDFANTPTLDHCYRWVYYTGTPRFDDYPGIRTD